MPYQGRPAACPEGLAVLVGIWERKTEACLSEVLAVVAPSMPLPDDDVAQLRRILKRYV